MPVYLTNRLIQRLQEELRDRTVVLVTHRPPLLQLVSRIVATGAGVIDVRRRTADLESIFRGEA